MVVCWIRPPGYCASETTSLVLNLGAEVSVAAFYEHYGLPECARRRAWPPGAYHDGDTIAVERFLADMVVQAVCAAPIGTRAGLLGAIVLAGGSARRGDGGPVLDGGRLTTAIRAQLMRTHWAARTEASGAVYHRADQLSRRTRVRVRVLEDVDRVAVPWVGGSVLGSLADVGWVAAPLQRPGGSHSVPLVCASSSLMVEDGARARLALRLAHCRLMWARAVVLSLPSGHAHLHSLELGIVLGC